MEKLKFSILSISVMLSFGLLADDKNSSSLYESAKNEVSKNEVINFQSSEERSKLRNKEILNQLKNNVLDKDISAAEKALKLKELEFRLNNVPAEYLNNVDKYLEKTYFNPKKEVEYPSLDLSKSGNNDVYPVETYAIDQQILIPQLKELKKPKSEEVETTQDKLIIVGKSIEDKLREEAEKIDSVVIEAPIEVPIEIPVEEEDSVENNQDNMDLSDIENLVSAEELAKIKAAMNSEDIVDTKSNTLEEIPEIVKDYAQIKNASIKDVFIFGDKKSVDLSVNIYVGDGIKGKDYVSELKNITENQIISVKGYTFKIESISFKEVVIKNMKTNEDYVASKSIIEL